MYTSRFIARAFFNETVVARYSIGKTIEFPACIIYTCIYKRRNEFGWRWSLYRVAVYPRKAARSLSLPPREKRKGIDRIALHKLGISILLHRNLHHFHHCDTTIGNALRLRCSPAGKIFTRVFHAWREKLPPVFQKEINPRRINERVNEKFVASKGKEKKRRRVALK